MAKKIKEQEPTLNSVTNRDILQRLNFLYQASAYLSSISPSLGPSDAGLSTGGKYNTLSRKEKEARRRKKRHPSSTADLSRSYVQSMKIIGQKTTVKMDPNVKRTICKECNTLMIPGLTASVRVKPSYTHGNTVSYICAVCKNVRRIPAPPVLDPDAEPATTAQPAELSSQTQSAAEDSGAAPDDAMVIDGAEIQAPTQECKSSSRPRKKRKGRPPPRLLPFFQRKGHVVFRGNERLKDEDAC